MKNTMRKKVFLYFFVFAVLVNSISVFTYANTKIMTNELNTTFTNDILLTNLSTQLDAVENSLKAYLTTSHSIDLKNYLNNSNELRNMVKGLKTTLSNDESELLLLDIKNMSLTYLDDTDFAVSEKRGRDISGYTDEFNEATKIYDYIDSYIDKLKIFEFKENNTYYLRLSNKLGFLQTFNIVAIIAAMVVNIVLILWFVFSITEPIIRLSKAASEIANGNLDVPKIKAKTNDEVKTLTDAFNRMTESLRRQLIEIRGKAKIESRLKEQEVQNLKMKSMLNEAELRALQAQIDPHFMFNTLNACMQLAMFEGAERTQVFIENFSELLRYNLGKISTPSTVFSEIENVESYIYLLKERFGDRVNFEKKIESDIPNLSIPRMILQPIVENSFIHGINGMETGGMIRLHAEVRGETVIIEVSDNGSGMTDEVIGKLMSGQSGRNHDDRAKTGNNSIGLKNVINRLVLFYHAGEIRDVIEFEGREGVGTKVTVKIPIRLPEEKTES